MSKFILLIAATCLALPAADQGATAKPQRGGGQAHQKCLERFDADKDGKLSESERSTARAALAARLKEKHPELLAKIDSNGDGVIAKEEMQAGRALLRERRAQHQTRAGQK